uniref:Cytochrome c oxidase assembly factor 3 n=1 Tax=Oryzias latipes TaxID=8090 RepID=A0A3P9GZU6_ORYLA
MRKNQQKTTKKNHRFLSSLLLRSKPAPLSVNMADKKPPVSDAPVATRIDPTKEGLSREQMHFIRQVEMEQWKKKTSKLRTRNVVTGLAIGAIVLGIYGYTFYSVSQERIMDEIDEEAKRAKLQGPKTGAN